MMGRAPVAIRQASIATYRASASASPSRGDRRRVSQKQSGASTNGREALADALRYVRKGDTIVVWKLDRLSRSLKDLLHILEKLEVVGAGFRSLTESIDTTTPAGRMMMQMVGSFAEFERAMIRERTSAGLAEARAAGRIGGRRAKLTLGQRIDVVENVLSGRRSAAEMARLYKVSEATISRTVAAGRAQGLVAMNSNQTVI